MSTAAQKGPVVHDTELSAFVPSMLSTVAVHVAGVPS
jgi:hypothetical protein